MSLERDVFRFDRLRASSSSKEGWACWGVNGLNDLPPRLVSRFVLSINNNVPTRGSRTKHDITVFIIKVSSSKLKVLFPNLLDRGMYFLRPVMVDSESSGPTGHIKLVLMVFCVRFDKNVTSIGRHCIIFISKLSFISKYSDATLINEGFNLRYKGKLVPSNIGNFILILNCFPKVNIRDLRQKVGLRNEVA